MTDDGDKVLEKDRAMVTIDGELVGLYINTDCTRNGQSLRVFAILNAKGL